MDIDTYRLMEDIKLARDIFGQPTDNPDVKDVFEIIQEIETENNASQP